MPRWIRWMLVDSSGSMKPLDRPMATQLRFQVWRRWPGRNLMTRGSVSTLPSMLANKPCLACSSARYRLQYTMPLPTRCCSGMRHCQPASRAMDRVYGMAGPDGLGLQRHGAVAEQVVRPVLVAHVQCIADEQPAEARAVDEQVAFDHVAVVELDDGCTPDVSSAFTSTILPSMRLTPNPSANLRRNFAYRPASSGRRSSCRCAAGARIGSRARPAARGSSRRSRSPACGRGP